MYAASYHHLHIIQYLLGSAAALSSTFIDQQDGDGKTALMKACQEDQLAIVVELVEKAYADLTVTDKVSQP